MAEPVCNPLLSLFAAPIAFQQLPRPPRLNFPILTSKPAASWITLILPINSSTSDFLTFPSHFMKLILLCLLPASFLAPSLPDSLILQREVFLATMSLP